MTLMIVYNIDKSNFHHIMNIRMVIHYLILLTNLLYFLALGCTDNRPASSGLLVIKWKNCDRRKWNTNCGYSENSADKRKDAKYRRDYIFDEFGT